MTNEGVKKKMSNVEVIYSVNFYKND